MTVPAASAAGTPPPPPPPPPPVVPATAAQKVVLCIGLFVLSMWALQRTYNVIGRVNEVALTESTAAWQLPAGAHLRVGPAAFRYDPERKMLSYRGPLDAAQQLRLRELLEFDTEAAPATTPPPATTGSAASAAKSAAALAKTASAPKAASSRASAAGQKASATEATSAGSAPAGKSALSADDVKMAIRSFGGAIDLLAYKSLDTQTKQIQLLLLLGCLGGALGALLRSFVDFVGNACYKNQLDLVTWWPLYVTRPMVGAILGFLLVVLFKAKLLTVADTQIGNDSFWWLGMAAIGGFSTIDVTARLRQAAKALFGGND